MHFCGCQMRSNEIKWGHSTCKAGVATSLLGELKQNTASNSSDSYADPDPLAWGSCSTPCYSPFSDRKCYQKGKPLTIVYHLMGKWLNVIHFKVLHQPLTILSIKSVLHCYHKNRTLFLHCVPLVSEPSWTIYVRGQMSAKMKWIPNDRKHMAFEFYKKYM